MKKFALLVTLAACLFGNAQAVEAATLPSTAAGRITIVGEWSSPSGPRISAFSIDPANLSSCIETLIVAQSAILNGQYFQLHGTAGNDFITFMVSTTSLYCGKTINPVPFFAGGVLDVYGGGGNDSLVGGTGDTYIYGEGGDDVMIPSRHVNALASGGSGNDVVDATGNTTATLLGGDNDDILCADYFGDLSTVKKIDGGAGTDRWCGGATTLVNVDIHDCGGTGCHY